MKRNLLKSCNQILLTAVILVLGIFEVAAQTYRLCPTPPATCGIDITSNSAATQNVVSTMCVRPGATFTGTITGVASTATIYVYPGATFNPSSIQNWGGTIINCGTASFPAFNFSGPGNAATFENYGRATMTGLINTNTSTKWVNGLNAKLTFNTSLTIKDADFYNEGNIILNGSFVINTASPGFANKFVNRDSITANGEILLNAGIVNDGFLFAKGNKMTLNSQGNITNGCFFISDGDFTYNGQDTLIVTGLTWVTSVAGDGNFIPQGRAVYVADTGFIQGVNFVNNGVPFYGGGDLYFSGQTQLQGVPTNAFGGDAKGLNFYDASPTSPARIFDVQNSVPHSSVTKNPIQPKDNSYIPKSCSPIIKNQACIPPVNAGPPQTVCSPFTDADLIDATGSRKWTFVSGPSTATVHRKTGAVTGLTANGTYTFQLQDTLFQNCRASVQVTKQSGPNLSLDVSGDTVCANPTAASVRIINPQNGVQYEARLGSANGTLLGSATGGAASPLVIPVDVTKLAAAPSTNTVVFLAIANGCGPQQLTKTTNIRVNVSPTLNLTVRGDTICSNATTNPVVTITGAQAGVTYEARLGSQTGTVLGSTTAAADGNITINVNRTLLAAAPSNNTISITASVKGCGTLKLTNEANVRVNLNPTLTLTVRGDTICSNATVNPVVTITGAQAGVTYEARLGTSTGTVLGTTTATADGNITISVNRTLLAAAPSNNTIRITATIKGCGTQPLASAANVRVNLNPTLTLSLRGDTICSNAAANPVVTITNAQAGVTYQARLGTPTGAVLGSTTAAADGNITINIDRTLLTPAPSNNTIRITATIKGCGTQTLSEQANVRVNLNPTLTLGVRGDTICSNATANPVVTITGAQAGVTYEARLGTPTGTILGSTTATAAGNITININRTLLAAAPSNNTIRITATIRGCGTQTLSNQANVRVNLNPTLILALKGDTICSNATTNPTVTISGAEAGVTYEARLGSPTGTLLGSTTATASGEVIISVNRALLAAAPSNNTIRVRATIKGCGTQTLSNQAIIRVNRNPNLTLALRGDTICSNSTANPVVTITGAEAGVTYEARLGTPGGVLLGSRTPTSGGVLTITVDRTLLAAAPSNNTIRITATIKGCGTQTLANTANIRVNTLPLSTATVSATGPVCAGGKSKVTIGSAEPGVRYFIYDNGTFVGSVLAASTTASVDVNMNVVGNPRTITVKAVIRGCDTVDITDDASVIVNEGSDVGLDVQVQTPICEGNSTTLIVKSPQKGVIYSVYEGTKILTPTQTGGTADLFFIITGLTAGSHTLSVNANTLGCGDVDLIEKPVVVVNDTPSAALTVRGDTLCSNSTADSLVTVINAQNNVRYEAYLGTLKVGQGTGNGNDLRFAIDRSKLQSGNNWIKFRATIGGCDTIRLRDSANMRVNTPPTLGLAVRGDTICENATSDPLVTVFNAQDQVTYEAYLDTLFLGSGKGPAASLQFPVDRTKLRTGNNEISFRAVINGCGTYNMAQKANLRVNTQPLTTLIADGDTICTTGGRAPRVIVRNAEAGVNYIARKGTVQVGQGTGAGSDLVIAIDKTKLSAGNNLISFALSINGCSPGVLADTANIRINTLPTDTLQVQGSTVCNNSPNATLTVRGTVPGITYQAYEGNVPKGNPVTSTGSTVTLVINLGKTPADLDSAVANHTLRVEAFIKGCDIVPLKNTGTIRINPLPDSTLEVTGSVGCGNGTDALVTVKDTKAGEVYQAYKGSTPVGSPVTSAGGSVTLNIPVVSLGIGTHMINVSSTITGCKTVKLADTATIVVNEIPSGTLTVTGSTVCSNSANATVTVEGTRPGETYQAYSDNVPKGAPVLSTGTTTVLIIPVAELGVGTDTIRVRSRIAGCGEITLTDTGVVVVNQFPDSLLQITGSTVCTNSSEATVTIPAAKAGEVYQAYEGNVAKGQPVTSSGGVTVIRIPLGTGAAALNPSVPEHIITVTANIRGCALVSVKDTALIRINQYPDSALNVSGNAGCGGVSDATVLIEGTRNGETYQAYKGSKPVGQPVTSTGGDVVLRIPSSDIGLGRSIIHVSSSVRGCAVVNLKDSVELVISDTLSSNLEVIGDTVCSTDANAFVTVRGTKPGETYLAWLNNRKLRTDTISQGGDFTIRIPVDSLVAGQMNNIKLQSQIQGCGISTLTRTGDVLVNLKPEGGISVIGDTVCSNSAVANVTVKSTRVKQTYVTYLGSQPLDTLVSSGNDLTFTIPVSRFTGIVNIVSATVSIPGCAVLDLDNSARVIVNPLPSDTLKVVGDTVCSTSDSVRVTIRGTKTGETYQAFVNGTSIGSGKTSTGGNVTLALPVGGSAGLREGAHKITFTATITGCAVINLKDSADVLVNPAPVLTLNVIGDTVCSNSDSATVTIQGTRVKENYTAVINNVPVSKTIQSTGGVVLLKIAVSDLKPDTNIVSIRAGVEGCETLNLTKSAVIIVNKLPSANLEVRGDTICSEANDDAATVRILNTANAVVYTAYIGQNQIGQPVTSNGGDIILTLPLTNLQTGVNNVTFTASIGGCALVILDDTARVLVNKIPSVTSGLAGSVVCSDASSTTVTVLNSDSGAEYQAKSAGVLVGNKVTGTGGDVIIEIPLVQLKPDTNIISVEVSIKGCAVRTLTQTAKVVVNTKPDAGLETEGDTVCETSSTASVSILQTQKNVAYQAYLNGNPVGGPVISTGGTTRLSIPVSALPDVNNKLTVRANIEKCQEVLLKDTALVVVNRLPQTNSVSMAGSSVCPGEDGEVTISGGEAGVIYTLNVNGQPTGMTFAGQSPAATIVIPAVLLNPNPATVTLTGNIPACAPVTDDASATIYTLSEKLNISGPSILCDSTTGEYSVTPLQGVIGYKWSTDNDATIVGADTGTTVKVSFLKTSASVSVVPAGTKTTCPVSGDTLFVRIESPVRGTGEIIARDTLCINETDSVKVINLTGVSYFTWVWSDSLDYLGKAVRKRQLDSSYVIKYNTPGWVTLKAKAYSMCAGRYVDSVTKRVRVLSVPVVEANEYEIQSMIGALVPVNLNGEGTSVTSGLDTITYNWTVNRATPAEIFNPTSLNEASVKPTGEETKVYLTAVNVKGYCPVTDSAIVRVTFKIQIPNVFTPNGDGVHDRWEIKNLNAFFPDATVEIFNKWGSFVYRSATGYPEPWDGTRSGEEMPVATYYYIVDLKNGEKPYVGSVTIIR